MDLILLFRKLVFAQVLLGIVAFCMAEQKPELLLLAGSLAALSWYVVEGPTGKPLPQGIIVPGALAAVGWLALEMVYFRNSDAIRTVGHFTMWLQVLQLYARKSNREYALLLVLSLLQMVGASTLPGGLTVIFGGILILYCILALFTVLIFQFKSTSDLVQQSTQTAAPAAVRVERPRLIFGRGFRWQFRATAGFIGIFCGAAALLTFLLLPRGSMSALGEGDNPGVGRSVGFSPTVQLSGGPPKYFSREPVLHLTVELHGQNLAAGSRTWYLRGAALDAYSPSARAWLRSEIAGHSDVRLQVPPEGRMLGDLPGTNPSAQATVRFCGPASPILFTLLPPAFVAGTDLTQITFSPLDQQLQAEGLAGKSNFRYVLRQPLAPAPEFFASYRRLEEKTTPTPDETALPDNPRARYARGWQVQNATIRTLAQGILRPLGLERDPTAAHDPRDARIMQELSRYLHEKYQYSLSNPPPLENRDPIVDFLTNRREGHCELFASGLAALARSVGIPVRVVTGYVATDYNSVGGYYVVRLADAHAWCEAEIEPGLWHAFDPTPPGALASEHPAGAGFFAWLRNLYEHVEYRWINSVLTYDNSTRDRLLQGMRSSLHASTSDDATWLGQTVQWMQRQAQQFRSDALGQSIVAGILAAIGLGVLTLVRIWVLRRRRLVALQLTRLPRQARRALVRQLGFYLTMLDMLERHGHHRPHWQSPFAFAQELAQRDGLTFEPVVALTEHFYEIRFGHRTLDIPRKRLIRAHLSRLEETLSQTA